MEYLDFGIPISFGYTAQYLPQKTVTRRDWKDGHAAKFANACDRAAAAGRQLRVPAIDKAYYAGGKQIGWLILAKLYKEKLANMPETHLTAEGGMCATIDDFIAKYFKGDSGKVVWVIRFKFEPCQKSELSKSSQELEVFASDLNQLEDLNSLKPLKSPQLQEQYTQSTFQAHQFGTTCELFILPQDNSTASLVAAPAKTSAVAENDRESTAIAPVFGGKCCESLTSVTPTLSDGKTLRERCLADVEKWLPASEWLDIKSRAQSLYRLRNSERPTSEKGFSLLPTPTTYPIGSKPGTSPAGRNKLESFLRLPASIPTPRANDGTQGYNNGKSGGMNLTGYLRGYNRLATPSARDFEGTSPTKKKGAGATLPDNLHPFILPTESANPQVWGWMMGFPTNWCESVLMPLGLLGLDDQDGGSEIYRQPLPDYLEKKSKAGGKPSVITGLPASPPKLSPLPSESSSCSSALMRVEKSQHQEPIEPLLDAEADPVPEVIPDSSIKEFASKTSLKILTSSKSDEHYTPAAIVNAAREVMGGIDLDPMSSKAANKTVGATKFYSKEADGLTKPWIGRVWLNPAFSLANEAVSKLIQSHLTGEVSEAVLLIKAAPDTARHQLLAALPFCEWRGRIKFIADGNSQVAPFAVLIFYLGKNFSKFREVFGRFGNIRLGQNQVVELENDRRDLLAKVAQLQLELAKNSDTKSEPDRLDWLERDINEQVSTAEYRLRELEIDREILPFEIFSRQHLEWDTRLKTLNYTQRAIASINIRFTERYREITEREHPTFEEDLENYTPDFAPDKLVGSDGHLLVKIKRYEFIIDEWIAWCEVRVRGNIRFVKGTEFYIKPTELFSDFKPPLKEPLKIERLSIYGLGSICTVKQLKSLFRGVTIPTHTTLWCTELTASDGSIWQAFKENDTERCAIKWQCEVLPDGFSRSPRIPQKNDRLEAATNLNSFVKHG